MIRSLRVLGALAFAVMLLAPTAASAADDAKIDHSEFSGDTLTMLVSVPGDAPVELDSVSVQVGGETATATAESAEANNEIERVTVLAIDTSLSMRGERIAAAKQAALAYLEAVPANVQVGIVTFDNDVVVRQQPAAGPEARAASRQVITGLTLKLNTKLYDGLQRSITTAGAGDGQRQILLLSDGADNTRAPVEPVIEALESSTVQLDVVSLQQDEAGTAILRQLANAGRGVVIDSDPEALSAAFEEEAAALARQILVTATIPDGVTSTSANVALSLTAAGEEHTTTAFLAIREAGAGGPKPAEPPAPVAVDGLLNIPTEAVYGGLAAIFLGVVGLVWAFSTGSKNPKLGLADQIAAYGTGADRKKALKKQAAPTDTLKDSAKAAAESMLASNTSIEARIANRLEGAGMSLKPPEWILIHAGVTLLVLLVGVLAGGGTNIPLMVMFLFMGAFGPWVYLSMKRSRRVKAFGQSLPDTLQLMSGSLSAGLSLAQSLDTIVREGSEPMTSEFKRVIAETRLGVSLEDALEGVAQRMDSKDFTWVIMAIRIQREVGGNLAELLLTVAATLREREYLRRQVLALSAEGRLSAYILGGLPPVFMLYLTMTKGDYVEPMYTTPIGWVGLGVMAILLTVGFIWMLKVAKVEI